MDVRRSTAIFMAPPNRGWPAVGQSSSVESAPAYLPACPCIASRRRQRSRERIGFWCGGTSSIATAFLGGFSSRCSRQTLETLDRGERLHVLGLRHVVGDRTWLPLARTTFEIGRYSDEASSASAPAASPRHAPGPGAARLVGVGALREQRLDATARRAGHVESPLLAFSTSSTLPLTAETAFCGSHTRVHTVRSRS